MTQAPRPFILASASPRRKMLLEQIGFVPDSIIAAEIDESPNKAEIAPLYALRMAREKAEKVAQTECNACILSADTVVACGSRILPKAEDEQTARACLQKLSARRHKVHTGVCLWVDGRFYTKLVTSMVQFKRLSVEDIDWYIKSSEWQGKAGGYAVQGAAQSFIKRMDGSYSAVVGLPLYEVREWLLRLI